MEEHSALMSTNIPSVPKKTGKARDIYDFGEELVIVTTDRISAFDVIMPDGVPGKGKILTKMTQFWLDFITNNLDIPHHLISTDLVDFPLEVKEYQHSYPNADLDGRVMLVKKLKVIPIECVVRGYISGSLWKEYQRKLKKAQRGMVKIHDNLLPRYLKESDRLPFLIFTPATKAETGHDENINFDRMVKILAKWLPKNGYPFLKPLEIANKLEQGSYQIYDKAAEYALSRGIIIADTKFEFGLDRSGNLYLIDEVLTPDSSRFWPRDKYQPGRSQESFDKQYVRDYLISIKWDKKPPAPKLPDEIVRKTAEKYEQALRLLTQ